MLFRSLNMVARKFLKVSFTIRAVFFTALAVFLSFYLLSCDDNGVGPVSELPPLPDEAAVYLSMDGTEAGLWILNANSLELIDSMITAPGVPWTIEFSPDYNSWYSCWGRGVNYSIYSCDIDPLSIRNSVPLQYANSSLVKSMNEEYLVAYINKGIEVFERSTLSTITKDTSLSAFYTRVVMSKNSNRFYFTKWSKNNFLGFGIYDLDLMSVVDEIILFDDVQYVGLEDVDIAVSNDDRYLFFSSWTWQGGFGGYGSFFVIDLIQRKIIENHKVGAFSQLCVSPDGQSVYISDPGGYLYNFPSSGKVWRYDVKNNSMHILLNNLYNSNRITVAVDNRTLFVTPDLAFNLQNGKRAWLVKVDALNGQIIDYYPVFYDSTGFFTNNPRNVRMGIYTIK